MSTHYSGIIEMKLTLSEEPGEKTFVVPYVLKNVEFKLEKENTQFRF